MTTGFLRVTWEATLMNSWPFSTPSIYPRMTLLALSSPRWRSMSDSLSTALFPRLINLEKPMFSPRAQSRMATQSAPDWEKKPIFPSMG
jgi:hypothetical protein